MRLEGVFSWEEPCKKPSSKTLDSGVPDLLTSEPRQRIAIKPSEITFNVGGPTFLAVAR
jgi:hypothetical protein